MADRYVLDPEGSEPLDITAWVSASGVDLGDAAMEPYRAEAEYGESVVDFRLPNRQMSFPLILRSQGGTTFPQIRSAVQAKVALAQREGIVLRRSNAQGTASVQVVAAGLTLSGEALSSLQKVDTGALLELEALPGWEEEWVELTSHEEKTNPELIFTEAIIEGDMPAPVKVEVIEKQAAEQKGLIWAFRSRRYSSATTAKSAYAATELGLLGEAVKGAVTGAGPSGTAVSNTALPASWTPILNTNIGGTSYLTHQGTYRVYARLRSPQGTAVFARMVWDVGDLVYPTENPAFQFTGGSAWYVADLGEVRLDAAPVGTHRWQGQIQAKGTEGGEDINIDRVWIVNEDEGMGVISAPPSPAVGELKAWDAFNTTTSGTITGKVAPLGGTWTGAGDAVGFTVDTANKWITRAEKSDSEAFNGYFARLGSSSLAGIDVQADVRMSGVNGVLGGTFLRYSSTSNWVMAVYFFVSTNLAEVIIYRKVGGTLTVMGICPRFGISSGEWRTIRAVARTDGSLAIYEGPQGGGVLIFSVVDSVLASGGSLETGGYGIYDSYTGSESSTRAYDNFVVNAAPTADAVLYASQKAQLTTQGMYRLDTGGTAYGPVSRVVGDLPRIPPTLGGRTTEVFIKGSRGDFERVADGGVDDIAAKVSYRPTFLTFPS